MLYVNTVTVYPSSITLQTGKWYYNAVATVCPPNADCPQIEWVSDNPAVATVNATSGYIFAVRPGTATIYARSTDGSDVCDCMCVTVMDKICVSSITLSRVSITLEKGDCFTLTAAVAPVNATNKTLNWRSTNPGVATVSGGSVTAKAKGSAYIYAEATDGSGEYARCQVTVTDDVLVTSVSVEPMNKTMTVGDSTYLAAIVCPRDATDNRVIWESCDPDVATVNPNSGLVYAQNPGPATIRATALDGSGKYGESVITVESPIPVTDITVSPESLTMEVGQTALLNVTVCPTNATNKRVTWCSSNEDVAAVDYYTGEIVAKSAGETTIEATTVDGEFSSCCTVTVIIERVTIRKDGIFNKVIFESSGKVWRCINCDTIFDEENMVNSLYTNRARHNFFTYFDEEDDFNSIKTPKEYTDEEIKLLYAIDPYGVADYVQRYSAKEFAKDGLTSSLAYKDRIFKLIFKRDPKYYARSLDGIWYVTNNTNNLSAVVSESETLFGMHVVYDAVTILSLFGFALDIASIAFSTTFFASGEIKKRFAKLVLSVVRILSVGEALVMNDLVSYQIGSYIDDAAQETNLGWANNLVSVFDDINEIAESISAKPNYYGEIWNYCAYNTNYHVFVELKNGNRHRLDDICSAINN